MRHPGKWVLYVAVGPCIVQCIPERMAKPTFVLL